jgi:hypothetical protein
LALLAQKPELRPNVLKGLYEPKALGPVRVVAFTGRQSDSRLGIWGEIASQLGRKEQFKDYYSPLQAPGQTAWINLLKGEPLLILLDELPPYLDNARSVAIGNSDLAQVTTTALANLLVAVGKQELANVCVVISDLRATYATGSQRLSEALTNLKNEVSRSAMVLEPVGLNTDELYHILRKRIFDQLPSDAEIKAVAAAYAQGVKDAKQMDITNASPEQFAAQLQNSFPFHFAVRDLYARFRENLAGILPGFRRIFSAFSRLGPGICIPAATGNSSSKTSRISTRSSRRAPTPTTASPGSVRCEVFSSGYFCRRSRIVTSAWLRCRRSTNCRSTRKQSHW